jgi:hypothetical protein
LANPWILYVAHESIIGLSSNFARQPETKLTMLIFSEKVSREILYLEQKVNGCVVNGRHDGLDVSNDAIRDCQRAELKY